MKKLSTLLTLSILLTGCVNPYCQQASSGQVDGYAFDACLREVRKTLPPTHTPSAQQIDACAARAQQETISLCGLPL